MRTKTKEIHFRVTDAEYQTILSRSRNFQGITHYIMSALSEFSDKNHRQKVAATAELISLYRQANVHLAHLGGNFNQSLHHMNELVKAGYDTQSKLTDEVIPQLHTLQLFCYEFQAKLRELTEKYAV